MGKKKRATDDTPKVVPLFIIKKKKLNEETSLTALVALHKYCHKFKLGTPGFRQKNSSPFLITCVMDGNDFGSGQHGNKDKAVEQAALVTLHLLDPDGKSITANITHSHEGELKRLTEQIANARHDEVKITMNTPSAFIGARVIGNYPFPQPLPQVPTPFPQYMLANAPGGVNQAPMQVIMPGAPLPVPFGEAPRPVVTAPLPPLAGVSGPRTEDGIPLVWTDESRSMEEVRAALPKYAPPVHDLVVMDAAVVSAAAALD